MTNIFIREPRMEDREQFVSAMKKSADLHYPWVKAPDTDQEFDSYFQRCQQPDQKGFLVFDEQDNLIGVFNINGIVQGVFQSAYLGFYGVAGFTEKGYMSAGLKLILQKVFHELKLHRIEANIQPENKKSLRLVTRNGFRYEGYAPRYLKINHEWQGHEHWAMTYEDFIRDDQDVLALDKIDIIPWDPEWPAKANREMDRVSALLPSSEMIDIQHIGSTAILNMAAKPVIDIQIAVRSLETMKRIAIEALQKAGYVYWSENPDPTRMFFVKGMPPYGKQRTHHVHIVESTSREWIHKIAFRDYLIAHPALAKEYQALKISLASQYQYDREKYTDAKGEFIGRILKLALHSDTKY